MKYAFLFALLLTRTAYAQTFQKIYGGAQLDRGVTIAKAKGNTFVISGVSSSAGNGGEDAYLFKATATGEKIWEKYYGASGSDNAWSVLETPDGGFLSAGFTNSSGNGGYDVYLFKTDKSGNRLWEKTYGGKNDEFGWDLLRTRDNNYLIVAQTESYGAGEADGYLIKVNEKGDTLWTKTYGGPKRDRPFYGVETPDGGLLMSGGTFSFGNGGNDAMLIKVDAKGKQEWLKTFGDSGNNVFHTVIRGDDNGFLALGYGQNPAKGNLNNILLVKIDQTGKVSWEKTLEAGVEQRAIHGQALASGYMLCGYSTKPGRQDFDAMLLRIDRDGNKISEQLTGGEADDSFYSLQVIDHKVITTGYTQSMGKGQGDLWIMGFDLDR